MEMSAYNNTQCEGGFNLDLRVRLSDRNGFEVPRNTQVLQECCRKLQKSRGDFLNHRLLISVSSLVLQNLRRPRPLVYSPEPEWLLLKNFVQKVFEVNFNFRYVPRSK